MSPTIVTGEQTGWTFDSSMRSSETEAQRRFTADSDIGSPDFRVSMYASTLTLWLILLLSYFCINVLLLVGWLMYKYSFTFIHSHLMINDCKIFNMHEME